MSVFSLLIEYHISHWLFWEFWELIYKHLAWYVPQSKHSINFSSKINYLLSFYFLFFSYFTWNEATIIGATNICFTPHSRWGKLVWNIKMCFECSLCRLQTQCLCHIELLIQEGSRLSKWPYIIQGCLWSYRKRHSIGLGASWGRSSPAGRRV